MDVVIKPCEGLFGELSVPPSKSYGQRAIASSFLVPNVVIENLGDSQDEKAALTIVQSVGASILKLDTKTTEIALSYDFKQDINIQCYESGLCARLFLGLLLLNQGKNRIDGSGSLLMRPMDSIFSVYDQLDISYTSQNGRLPIEFLGSRLPQHLSILGDTSSQFVSGLLYYLVGLSHSQPLRLHVHKLSSRPYLNMTMDTLRQLGGNLEWEGDAIWIQPSLLKKSVRFSIEADWSSAAFWIVAAAIGGSVRLLGLNPNSLQADRKIMDVIEEVGTSFAWNDGVLKVEKFKNMAFRADITHAPDLAPILAVLAIFSEGESSLVGVQRLVYKESNRLDGILKWFKMLQIPYILSEDQLKIQGTTNFFLKAESIDNKEFDTYNDHRMVMAASILALFLNGGKVKGFKAVQKSYPNFFGDFEKLGGQFFILRNE